MDGGDAAEAEQVLGGCAVAGAAALSVPYVREGTLDLDALAQFRAPVRASLALAQPGEQFLVAAPP